MRAQNVQTGRRPSTDERRLLLLEDEALGRFAWGRSTKTGVNLSAPTSSDLRALGAKVRAGLSEGLTSVDAAIRAAADVASLGLADEISAAANASLGGGGSGSFEERYARLHADEQDLDAYNAEHRPIATVLGQVGMTGLTFTSAANAGAKAVSGLSPKAKGFVGERMSDARTVISGDIPFKHGKRLDLKSGGHTFTDHQTVRGNVVEAKMGPNARLTNPQRRAQAEYGPRYRYDHWSFDDVGRVFGGAVVGTQQGLNRISNRLQDRLDRSKSR